MKLPLKAWGTRPAFNEENGYLLRVPNIPFDELALEISQLTSDNLKPAGLVPPFDPVVMADTYRCMASLRDHFPTFSIYAPIPKWTPREHIRRVRAAGFDHFILQKNGEWPIFYQEIHDLLKGFAVHAAGGNPQVDGWTWSDEDLI